MTLAVVIALAATVALVLVLATAALGVCGAFGLNTRLDNRMFKVSTVVFWLALVGYIAGGILFLEAA